MIWALFLGLLRLLVQPPCNGLALGLVGWLVSRRFKRTGRALVLLAVAALVAQSLTACSRTMLHALERYPALTRADFAPDVGAIVVLGAGVYHGPEFGSGTIGELSVLRVRYGAWLHRATGLPLLVTGGQIVPQGDPLGERMARSLREEFDVPVEWVENRARNTYENAQYSAEILHRAGVRKIYLVTTASHMWRSKTAFEAMGLEVVPAPTDFSVPFPIEPGDFLPSARGVNESATVAYEVFGMLWYRLVYYGPLSASPR